MLNVYWFQLLGCEELLFLSDCKLHLYWVWAVGQKKRFVMGIYYYFIELKSEKYRQTY